MLEILFQQIYKHRQIGRYIISGGTAALVNLGLLYILTSVFGVWYLFSAALSFAIAFFVSFFLQKFWTFRDQRRQGIYQQGLFYFLVALINLVLNEILLYVAVSGLGIWYLLAQILVSAIIAVESFLIYKFFIFKRPTSAADSVKLTDGQNILIATGIYPPDYRGPATMLEALPNALSAKGFATKIITYSDIIAVPEETGRVYRILRRQAFGLSYLKFFWQLYRLVEWASVIYVTDTYSVGYFVYLIKKITGKKYIVRFAGDSAWEIAAAAGLTEDYIVDFQNKKYEPRIEKLKERRRKILIGANRVVAVSHFMANLAKLIGVSEDRIKVIYNSIDFISPQEIDPAAVVQIKKRYGRVARLIVTAGQLVKWKGVAGVIKILPAFEEKIGPVNLLVLGDGQELANLKKITDELGQSGNVFFLGKIKRSQILNYFSAADLFILNTNYEGLSHTLLEAMKAGAPIVTTNVGGNPEVIENGKDGLLVGFNNQLELSEAALKILTNPELAENLKAGAKEKLKKFIWANTAEETAKLFNETINE